MPDPGTSSPEFTCKSCGETFTMPPAVLEKYPGWTPTKCRRCHKGKRPRNTRPAAPTIAPAARAREVILPEVPTELAAELQGVLARYSTGPLDGVFTDGGCSGNPGPGGWGAVLVRNDEVIDHRYGRAANTTNNRMELMALQAGFEMIAPDEEVVLWSDSQLCVNTLTQWAQKWEKNGWRRKGGPIKNLDLIKPLYRQTLSRPRAQLRWLKAHNGSRWNEYVDTLATAFLIEDG